MKKRLLALPLLILAACGSSTDPQGGTLQIEATAPETIVVGQNTLQLKVTDADAQPVIGADVTVTPFMPAHGHGSSETPVVTDNGDGTYVATPVTLTMPGSWEITLHAQSGDQEGERVLTWDVE